jgi:hypothetical protein
MKLSKWEDQKPEHIGFLQTADSIQFWQKGQNITIWNNVRTKTQERYISERRFANLNDCKSCVHFQKANAELEAVN